MKLIKDGGFKVSMMKEMLLTPEEANKIYFKISAKEFYKDILEVLSE
jgi:nucleoside diphosphate kinase